jgi:hypothetical protein
VLGSAALDWTRPVPTDHDLAQLLRCVDDGDSADAPVDNAMIAASLGWSLETVAACLQDAKDRSFVWGSRSGERPAPWFTELEVTVQGKRFIAAHPVTA